MFVKSMNLSPNDLMTNFELKSKKIHFASDQGCLFFGMAHGWTPKP